MVSDTVPTHQTHQIADDDVSTKWPKKVKHRNKVLAKIYRPCHERESYRIVWYAAGKRQMKSLLNYSGRGGAKEFAESFVIELAKRSQAVILTTSQATDALAAIERLIAFQVATGRKISLLGAVSEYCGVAAKVGERSFSEVAEGFLCTVATVKRKDLKAGVEEFLAGEEPKTHSHNGKRAQIAEKYHYNRSHYLHRFADSFPGYAVCDLGKRDLDAFFSSKLLTGFSPKSRNHHRTAIAQFVSWCVRKDFLPVGSPSRS